MPYGRWVNELPTGCFVAVHQDIGVTVVVR
jgi:hypothetical protein